MGVDCGAEIGDTGPWINVGVHHRLAPGYALLGDCAASFCPAFLEFAGSRRFVGWAVLAVPVIRLAKACFFRAKGEKNTSCSKPTG